MKLTYRITPEDYADAQRAHCSSKASWRWRNRITLATVIFALALSILIAIISPYASIMLRPAILMLSLFLAFLLLRYTNLLWRWQYNKIDSLKREFTSEITDEGITSSSDVSRSEVKWNLFVRWYEGKSVFLLYQQPVLFNIVPKRVFGPGEAEQFRDLLQRKIPAQK